jgi:hypothetical protein
MFSISKDTKSGESTSCLLEEKKGDQNQQKKKKNTIQPM